MKKRIGLMGGTFNPVHNGHLLLAQEAKEQHGLDEIWFLPSKRPPHKDKDELTEDEIRCRMLALAVEDNPDFCVSLLEMQRDGGNTYTYDTMLELKEKYPEHDFYFMIGADSLFELHKWYHYEELLHGMAFLVAPRGGEEHDVQDIENKMAEYREKYQAKLELVDMPLMEISSTDLRKKAGNGRTLKYYLPDRVEEFIRMHRIYREE